VVPIAARCEHTVRNESAEEVEAVVLFSPGEPMERFARAAADLDAPGHAELVALAEAHGIEMTRSIEDALMAARPAYLTIARFSGDPDRLLDHHRTHADVMSGVGRDHGLILHAGAQTQDGFMVVNLWPSQDGSEAAARDPRRLRVLEQTGIDPGSVEREHHEVAELVLFDRFA
jgi:hypothetical protein